MFFHLFLSRSKVLMKEPVEGCMVYCVPVYGVLMLVSYPEPHEYSASNSIARKSK